MRYFFKLIFPFISMIYLFDEATFAREIQTEKPSSAQIETPVLVTAGQEFYKATATRAVAAYRLEHPFKSSMAGSMGMSFAFAIDGDLLVSTGKTTADWEYFVPPDHKFRAYHSLLGSVIRGADTVGLRVGRQGQMEWFVDNSAYYKSPKIWTRRLKSGDPTLTRIELATSEPAGEPAKRLIYLGLADNGHARVLCEQVSPRETIRNIFTVQLDREGIGQGTVSGVEFKFRSTPNGAVITITKVESS